MTSPRHIGSGLLLFLLAGCATQPASTGPSPVPAGPRALIHAQYTGGLLNRAADAVFKVEESAYVMVVHLGGDGQFTVLYPEDGRESGHVSGGKWFRTQRVAAYYDATPRLYSFAATTYRSFGAQLDSYDGRGYGYIFLIASKRPLGFGQMSQFGLWNEVVAQDYESSYDPRGAIRDFASMVAGGAPYTLKYARSTGTVAMTSLADELFDCALLSDLGFASYLTPFSYMFSAFSPFGMSPSGSSSYGYGCQRYQGQYAYGPNFGYYRPWTPSAPSTTPTTPLPRVNPTMRPPRHTIGEVGSGLSFANPTRRNSPESPSNAPRDWTGLRRQSHGIPGFEPVGSTSESGSRSRSSGSTASGTRSSSGSTRTAPVQRVEMPRAQPVTRAATPSTSTSSKASADKKQQ